jgi:two-component system sensor histidine kinase BaeS
MERLRKAMVSDVSHELRTPLSNIRGWLEAAQDGVAELDPVLIASLVEGPRLCSTSSATCSSSRC